MEWSPQQDAALHSVRRWLENPGSKKIFRLFGYAGSGKTTLAIEIAEMVKGRCLFASFTGKASLVMRRKGCAGARTIHSLIYKIRTDREKDEERDDEKPLFELNPDSDLCDADLLIIDECFVAGTLVDTPFGPRPIEQLQPGDLILNAGGVDRIVATSKKEALDLVRVKINNFAVTCSSNHPFFTRRGLIHAGKLKPGDEIVITTSAMSILRERIHAKEKSGCSILQSDLLDALVAQPAKFQGSSLQRGSRPQQRRRQKALAGVGTSGGYRADRSNSQSNSEHKAGGSGENQSGSSLYEASTACSWRQRSWTDASPTIAVHRAWSGMGDGIYCSDENQTSELAGKLQHRYRAPSFEDSDRSGRGLALLEKEPSPRQTEDVVPSFKRVEGVEILEPGDSRLDQCRDAEGKLYLYDLQAASHSSFSVSGVLVHNCSMVNEELGRDVMSFDVPVLVLGDPAQLPPVSGGGYFTEHEPDVMLTEIHRQAEGNPIIHVATDVRLGRGLKYGSMVGDGGLVGVSIVKRQQLMRGSMLRADQILCGRNDTRNSLNRKMRALLREKRTLPLGPAGLEDRPVVGDRVICLKNKRDRGIFNGGIFRVKELLDRKPEAKRPGRVDVSYMMLDSEDDERNDIPAFVPNAFWHWNAKEADLKLPDELSRRKWDEFDYAYAITCHKSQGSQWDKVVVIDESSVFSRGPNGDEMARRWLYTACSRAAEKLIIAR